MLISNINFQELSSFIEEKSFAGESGLLEACDCSDKIYQLQSKILKSLEYQDLGKIKELHKKLEAKVISAQKGNLIFSYFLFLKNNNEQKLLKEEYEKVKKELQVNSWRRIALDKNSREASFEDVKDLETKITNQLKKSLSSNRLFEPVIQGICNQVEIEQKSQGFIYKVTNRKSISSYLVGTIHQATKAMIQAPALKYVIEHSDRLILEVNSPLVRFYYKFKQLNIKDPFRYSIDFALYDDALNKGCSIENLETLTDQIHAVTDNISFWGLCKAVSASAQSSITSFVNHYVKTVTEGSMQDRLKGCGSYILAPSYWLIKKEIQIFQWIIQKQKEWLGLSKPIRDHQPAEKRAQSATMIDLWQDGRNISFFNLLFENLPKTLIDERNKKWLQDTEEKQGISTRLSHTNEPLCYAFGATHLVVGNPNILGSLRTVEGLKIERGYYNYETCEMEWTPIG